MGFHCPECAKSGKQQVYQGIGSLRSRPVVTIGLMVANVAIYMIGIGLGGGDAVMGGSEPLQRHFALIAKASFDGRTISGVAQGEWYRMVSSGFLHYGALHLAMNMYALWILGQAIEQIGGRARMATIYFVSLLAGSLGALVMSPGSLTAGASGAIFGLMGALLLAHRAAGIPFRNSPLLPLLFINAAFTLGVPGISIGGHLGGFIGGAIAGWVLLDYGVRREVPPWLPYAICGALTVGIVVAGVVTANNYLPGVG